VVKRSIGQVVKRSSGQVVKRSSGQVVKRSSGQVVKWSSGQVTKECWRGISFRDPCCSTSMFKLCLVACPMVEKFHLWHFSKTYPVRFLASC
jgi:hypothetical protein